MPKRGQNIANHLWKFSQAFVKGVANNQIVLTGYDQYKRDKRNYLTM